MCYLVLITKTFFGIVVVGSLIAVIDSDDPHTGATMEDVTALPHAELDKEVVDDTVIESPVVDFDDVERFDHGVGEEGEVDVEDEDIWLFQYHPVEIGYEQDVEVEDGMVLQMKTMAVNPPVFEIRNFLSDEECAYLMKLALERGLLASQTVPDPSPSENENENDNAQSHIRELFQEYDEDGNGYLDASELREVVLLFPAAKDVELDVDHVQELIKRKLDQNDDGLMDIDEFISTDTTEMDEEIERWLVTEVGGDTDDGKRSKARVSEQTWLDQLTTDDEVLLRLQDRVIGLTLLPSAIVQTSEHLQVVRYEPGGHYHAHYDSNNLDDELECAHTYGIEDDDDERKFRDSDDFSRKRLCRLVTVLFYLNDVEEGGETAFPVADNDTFTQENIDTSPYDIYDLSRHCHKSKVVVPPEKGKAIMWYNHYLNEETGWLGENRNYSLHGGCDVIRGEKWIANNWITVDDKPNRQILFHKKHFSDANEEPAVSETDEMTPEGIPTNTDELPIPDINERMGADAPSDIIGHMNTNADTLQTHSRKNEQVVDSEERSMEDVSNKNRKVLLEEIQEDEHMHFNNEL